MDDNKKINEFFLWSVTKDLKTLKNIKQQYQYSTFNIMTINIISVDNVRCSIVKFNRISTVRSKVRFLLTSSTSTSLLPRFTRLRANWCVYDSSYWTTFSDYYARNVSLNSSTLVVGFRAGTEFNGEQFWQTVIRSLVALIWGVTLKHYKWMAMIICINC